MELHTLKRKNPNQKARQVGRGGTRGKTSGRGGKGQTARAGNKRRPQMRDIIKKLPKLRGYRFQSHTAKKAAVNVGALNIFESGAKVTSAALFEKNLVRRHGGVHPAVKILGSGDLTVKLEIIGCEVSEAAKAKIEKAGGSVK
jgi:large subunit ribosomal protein L15